MTSLFRRALPILVTAVAFVTVFSRVNFTALLKAGGHLTIWAALVVVAALLAGQIIASLRLQLLARDLRAELRFRDALTALTYGQLGGTLFFQVIGQTIARSAVLSRVGWTVSGTIVLTGYERLVAALVSFTLALAGAFVIFGKVTIDLAGGGAELLELIAGLAVVALTGAVFVWGEQAWPLLRGASTRRSVSRMARAALISLAIQLTTMLAYCAAALSLFPSVSLLTLVAAIALVMLAASIPISFGGWGVRELSAVYALGAIGFPNGMAIVVALLVGGTSLAITAAIVGALALQRAAPAPTGMAPRLITTGPQLDFRRFLAWVFPLFAASTVFFQAYVPVGTGRLNVNLADSVVLFGGALFVQRLVADKSLRITSRLPWLHWFVAAMSAVIILACFHGWLTIGWTSWAFTNRLFGWLVLLCYAATGALLVLEAGERGREILLKTFVVAGLAVAAFNIVLMVAVSLGAPLPVGIESGRIEGFAQNPNAFAFQLLLVMIAALGLGRSDRRFPLSASLTLALLVLYFTGSRAGWGTCLAMSIAAALLGFVRPDRLLRAACAAVIAVGLVMAIGWAAHVSGAGRNAAVLMYHVVKQDSDTQRLQSMLGGLHMFLAHPFFGGGLGVFLETFYRQHGVALVIHSTPIWLLAEMGIIGFCVFAAPYFLLLFRELRSFRHADCAGVVMLLMLVTFGIMCQVHELLFQRTLWLLLGAALINWDTLAFPAAQQSRGLQAQSATP